MNNTTPTRANVLVLKQILNLIPRRLINRHALETGVEAKARSFSVVSHLSAMLFAQFSHAMGLNDVCDWLRLKSAALARFGVTPPSKNGLSNANKERSAEFLIVAGQSLPKNCFGRCSAISSTPVRILRQGARARVC